MKQRCNNTENPNYYRYGAKGIKLCKEWESDFISFHKWSYENGYTDEMTIDRINPNKGYSPDNCQWLTKSLNSSKAQIQAGNITLSPKYYVYVKEHKNNG